MSFNLQSLRTKARTRVFSEFSKATGSNVTAENLILQNNRILLSESVSAELDFFDIFLSHSSKDAEVILGVVEKFNEFGYKVYVDWLNDTQLDRNNITKETSEILKLRMNQSRCLLYATTKHSSESKWMPWELGYMDGQKEKAAILPIFSSELESSYSFPGQEYLGIYPYCIQSVFGIDPNKEGLWIFKDPKTHQPFDIWLNSKKSKRKQL